MRLRREIIDAVGNRTEVEVNHGTELEFERGVEPSAIHSTHRNEHPSPTSCEQRNVLTYLSLVTSAIPASENILETIVEKHHKVARSVEYACP
jgi:hypothetical protein